MDSLTHITFGAALGGMLFGRRAGIRPFLYGALVGTLPDIDALFMDDGIGALLVHRGVTHSLFFQALAIPLLVAAVLALFRDQRPHWRRWTLLTGLVLLTHSMLDTLNPYGVQLFLPFSDAFVSFNAVYVVDPLFTLPLLIALWLAWRYRSAARPATAVALAFCAVYAGTGLLGRAHVQEIAVQELDRQGIEAQVIAMPTPFNIALWRVLAVDDERYYEGHYSFLDGTGAVEFDRSGTRGGALPALDEHESVERLKRFAAGFYAFHRDGETIVMRDLRLGQRDHYPVSFVVGRWNDDGIELLPDRRAATVSPGLTDLHWLWSRLWQPGADSPA